jgi:sulfide:quinone oxidoreductase
LFLGIPKHRVPDVVATSGMTVDGWIPVNPKNLKTRFPGVYAIGDVTSVGTPKAGVFSEGAARVVAASLIAEQLGGEQPSAYTGAGSCYIEFGAERVGRNDVDFGACAWELTWTFAALVGDKQHLDQPPGPLVWSVVSLRTETALNVMLKINQYEDVTGSTCPNSGGKGYY